jgi:hypothetical protein
MEATLTLHQAGNQLGVEDTVLSRLIRIGALPEARKVHRPDGDVWVIPTNALPAVAIRNGWTIDLRHDGPAVVSSDGTAGPAGSALFEGTTAPDSPEVIDNPEVIDSPEVIDIPSILDTSAVVDAPAPVDGAALVPHLDASPAPEDEAEDTSDPMPSMAEVVDLALLDRLLDVQEERVTAQVESRETRHALAALNDTHNRVTGELEIERRERMVTSDRYREERMARAVADAKVAELRDRVVREMALAESEKEARSEATARSIRAERDAANAMAVMSRRARRRYRKLNNDTE